MGGDYFQGQGGEGLALILSLCEGGLKLNFALWEGGYDLVLGHISPIFQPPSRELLHSPLLQLIYFVISKRTLFEPIS